jgi:hypothetical protein
LSCREFVGQREAEDAEHLDVRPVNGTSITPVSISPQSGGDDDGDIDSK